MTIYSYNLWAGSKKYVVVPENSGQVIGWDSYGYSMKKFDEDLTGEQAKDAFKKAIRINPGQNYEVISEVYTADSLGRLNSSHHEIYFKIKMPNGRLVWVPSSEVQTRTVNVVEKCDEVSNRPAIAPSEIPTDSLEARVHMSELKSEAELDAYIKKWICDKSAPEEKVCLRYNAYKPLLKRMANAYKLPYQYLACIVTQESKWKPHLDVDNVISALNKTSVSRSVISEVRRLKKNNENFIHYLEKNLPEVQLNRFWSNMKPHAVGLAQVKGESLDDTLMRLKNDLKTNRGKFMKEAWENYIGSIPCQSNGKSTVCSDDPNAISPYEKTAFQFANTEMIRNGKLDMFEQPSLYMQNNAINVGASAVQLSYPLWDHPSDKDGNRSFESYVLGAGLYNRGYGVFRKVDSCRRKNFNSCMKDTRYLCNKRAANSSHSGWIEGYRYMMSVQRCMKKGVDKNMELASNPKCPAN